MSFSVIYGDDKKIMGAIVATGHQEGVKWRNLSTK